MKIIVQTAFVFILFLFCAQMLEAQTKIRIYGYVIDANNRGLDLANVAFENTPVGTSTNKNGYYELTAEITDSLTIVYSSVGYKTIKHTIYPIQKTLNITVELTATATEIETVEVIAQHRQMSTLETIDPLKYRLMPNTSGGIESLFITFTGVSSTNELSSQYNVRGGNFDENIVYVNGIEVYRPLLIRAGQQEGLSFINQDMVDQVSFSSGGYDAKYGDKMSSVLDITYKKPQKFESTVSASLLGASAYVGSAGKRFTQIHGIRYKTSAYLLGTLDTDGEYNPSFIDYQTYLTYRFSPKWEISFLGNYAQNNYRFIPASRETSFGTYQMGRRFIVYFNGQEKDVFRTAFGALTLDFKPKEKLKLSLPVSVFHTNESETYDISGEYILRDRKKKVDAEPEEGVVFGMGKYHEHARNRLKGTVVSIGHAGEAQVNANHFKWGANIQTEIFKDKINEWEWRDSVGFSMPSGGNDVRLYNNLKSKEDMSAWRIMAYFQDTHRWENASGRWSATGGLRANYWNYNNELLLSPRASISFVPYWEKDFSFRAAAGLYYQSPFYKELRMIETDELGNSFVKLNKNIKAQRSLHLVMGGDHYFRFYGRPFKFTTEAYLKLADRVVSYTVDNVQIRYSGLNDAEAYTTGIDFKLFGELVPGVDSWINLSLMSSKEKLNNDTYIKSIFDDNGNITSTETAHLGWIPRPSEQRYVFSMFIQDYFPTNPKYRVHLRVIFSDGLVHSAPDHETHLQFRSALRSRSYKRIDIGTSRVFSSGKDKMMNRPFFKHAENIWLNFEILNLFNFKNVNSYYWVSDIYNQQNAVPNYLTGIQFNFRIMVDLK
jgi:hypothetical protein